jgi:hypothetical protein
VFAALSAAALTGWMRRLAATDSRWFRSGLHIALAAIGGTGGALLADDWAELAAFAVLAVGCGLLVVIDLTTFRLPNQIVGPLYPAMFLAAVFGRVKRSWAGWGAPLPLAASLGGLFHPRVIRPTASVSATEACRRARDVPRLAHVAPVRQRRLLLPVWYAALLITGRGSRQSAFPFGP